MSLAIQEITDAVVSHALETGYFERVNNHEPKSAPGNGLSASVWVDSIGPVPAGSGLARTSALLRFNVRLYTSMLSEPQDAIDPNLVTALDALLTKYNEDFTLGDLVRNVDLLGQTGASLSAQAGYLNQDNKLYRVFTITLPLVVNDVWDQGE